MIKKMNKLNSGGLAKETEINASCQSLANIAFNLKQNWDQVSFIFIYDKETDLVS